MIDRIRWESEFLKSKTQYWGLAISMGSLSYISSWETNNSEITLMLSGDNFEINCVIGYVSKKFKHLIEKEIDKKTGMTFNK
ncbi:MAG: hypothetical protein DRP42_02560 [Tenericutes bacterium]|nr:MAG: hypothetical protein DRP42_02560 [Mycoplasmatota bacterium]